MIKQKKKKLLYLILLYLKLQEHYYLFMEHYLLCKYIYININRNNFGISLVYCTSLLLFGRLSNGYFNPICTLIGFIEGSIPKTRALYYVGA